MLNFEQVKLLEAKVARAIDYVEQVTREKNALLQREAELSDRLGAYQKQEAELKAKLESYQGRIDELEVLVTRFKEDQGKIEESILSALDRLNQFEQDIENSLKGKPDGKPPKAMTIQHVEEELESERAPETLVDIPESSDDFDLDNGGEEQKNENWEDIPDPLMDNQEQPDSADDNADSQEKSGELDIF